MTTGKTIALTIQNFAGKAISLLLNMSIGFFFIAFLPMRKHLLILWLQSSLAVNSEPRNIKSVTASTYPNSICTEVMELIAMIIFFWMLSFKPAFFSLNYHPHERIQIPLYFLPLVWYYLHIWDCWYFSQQSWVWNAALRWRL